MLTREDVRKKMITDPRGLVEWVMELQFTPNELQLIDETLAVLSCTSCPLNPNFCDDACVSGSDRATKWRMEATQ